MYLHMHFYLQFYGRNNIILFLSPPNTSVSNATLSQIKIKCVSGNESDNFRLGRHTFFLKKKTHNFMHFERHFAFQNA